MSTRHFIVGTAGHIDHGKSSLIKALSGTDPDRLPEEKARGVTIDLGFASLALPGPESSNEDFSLGLVDVPGHADFVKNMVAGVGALDLALFIVAADDGWMPQTEEHYQILQYLGIDRAVLALTKIDLAEDIDLALMDIEENLEGGPWEDIPVVPVSSHTGAGIGELREAIARVLADAPPPRDVGRPRLPVDRAFSLKGVGTIVTGTLIDGPLAVGADLVVQPGGATATVRSAQSHGKSVESVPPGTRTAVNLSGVSLREQRGGARDTVGRGDILTLPEFAGSALAIDVVVTKSARPIRGMKQSKKSLRTGREVMFHHGSMGQPARLHLRGTRSLAPGESSLAELRFREPVSVFAGDRFVLRDASLGLTLGGGIVLDEDANRRAFRKPFQEAFLTARAGNTGDLDTFVRSQVERDKAVPLDRLLARSRFRPDEIEESVERFTAEGRFDRSGTWIFEAEWWRRLSGMAAEKVNAIHRDHPEQLGLPLRDLRALMEPELPSPRFFDMLLEGLLSGDFAKAGPNIRRSDHIPNLPPELEKAGRLVRKRLAEDPTTPPNKGETATNPAEEKALRFLTHTGEVIDLDPKTVISREGYDVIRDQIVDYLREHGRATASDLRKHTGTVRRILMPLLEKLDEEKVTVREGDDRRLRE